MAVCSRRLRLGCCCCLWVVGWQLCLPTFFRVFFSSSSSSSDESWHSAHVKWVWSWIDSRQWPIGLFVFWERSRIRHRQLTCWASFSFLFLFFCLFIFSYLSFYFSERFTVLELVIEYMIVLQWNTGLILHGVDIQLFRSPANWCNKGRGMYHPVCEMVHIKDPMLLNGTRA